MAQLTIVRTAHKIVGSSWTHFFIIDAKHIKNMGLDSLQNYDISTLYLTVGPRVIDWGPIMHNGMSYTKILKFFADKLCTIIWEYLVRYAKTQYNAPQKFDYILFGYLAYWLGFNPLCESIDRNNQKSITTLGFWKRA